MTWYERMIEKPIRPQVKILRDNGFNTTCSCGHDMYVEMDITDVHEIDRLYNLLIENGYEKIVIEFFWESWPIDHKGLMVRFGS